ncbi:MAG: type II secretion system GspH family protein [Lentisphaeraceae bacterium]|nr:type II secretion system GspH family protein [Lentisphaeraceae bacterium]
MKKKFTLIELLVVVAIIGILASMLLPALGSARAKVKMAACVSNLKQVGAAVYSYTTDGPGLLPGPCYGGVHTGPTKWDQSLSRYLQADLGAPTLTGSRELSPLFNCPSYTGVPSGGGVETSYQFITYGKDSYGERYLGYPGGKDPQSISSVESPTEETLLSEMDAVLITFAAGWIDSISATPRHGFKGGAGNRTQLFYDGHAVATTKLPQE